jgi:inhibitor of KinA sporulation pathway (predicted exonuclease)
MSSEQSCRMPERSRVLVNVIDVESTCWERQQAQDQISDIIEIGITVLDFETLDILSTESIIIKPKHSTVSKFCTGLTTITQEFVDGHGITFEEAAEVLKSRYSPKERLFASWGNYDRKQFEKQFALHGIPYVFGPKHLNLKALFAKCYQLKREVGMDSALKLARIPLQGTHHRGGDDSLNIAKLFSHVIEGRSSFPEFQAAFEQMRSDLP